MFTLCSPKPKRPTETSKSVRRISEVFALYRKRGEDVYFKSADSDRFFFPEGKSRPSVWAPSRWPLEDTLICYAAADVVVLLWLVHFTSFPGLPGTDIYEDSTEDSDSDTASMGDGDSDTVPMEVEEFDSDAGD